MTDDQWERIGTSIDAAVEGRVTTPSGKVSDEELREDVARAIGFTMFHGTEFDREELESFLPAADAVIRAVRATLTPAPVPEIPEWTYCITTYVPEKDGERWEVTLQSKPKRFRDYPEEYDHEHYGFGETYEDALAAAIRGAQS